MFRHLPKVELHCHLDASVRVDTVADIARQIRLELPSDLERALVAPGECADLFDYLSRIDFALDVMQRPQDLTRIARELVEDMAADGVIYAEIRFAPQLHTRLGLDMRAVLEAVHAGIAAGREATGMQASLILCCLRHQS
ncbi:MAG: adenosine deaminase, partial [Acidobacteria bacterium]|nr:adenosine deaminase [Acidobacteriota bacterium]